ncbi:MAG: AraC family transcriptional regulator [Pseudomonadales bacterium]|jgi:hypothetical protein|nr:AraC family transcriptional regulator [Pseudomonadales bacterium]
MHGHSFRVRPSLGASLLITLALLLPSAQAADADDARTPAPSALENEVQSLKEEVVALNRDLFILEEELLFPSSTQVQVFLSLDVGTFFQLESVQLELDGKEVANHLYTPREMDALLRGGVQRIHMANLDRGDHELVALFTGRGPNNRDYRRGAELTFDKALGPKYVELRIRDSEALQQPEFDIREWD